MLASPLKRRDVNLDHIRQCSVRGFQIAIGFLEAIVLALAGALSAKLTRSQC
jgi:hypothetical protein